MVVLGGKTHTNGERYGEGTCTLEWASGRSGTKSHLSLGDTTAGRCIDETDVTLNSQNYAQVQADRRVYAVDVMQQILTDAIQKAHPNADVEHITIQGSLLYGAMERMGIAPKPQKP